MYLQKQLSKKIGDKEYSKYVIVIPPKIVNELKWKFGERLKSEIKNGELIIEQDKPKFECKDCGHEFHSHYVWGDDKSKNNMIKCPKCNSKRVSPD